MSGDWKRVGQKVRERRIEIGLKTGTALAAKASLSARLLGDIERGDRGSYSASTKLLIEDALEWSHGDMDRIAAGGDASPVQASTDIQYDSELVATVGALLATAKCALESIESLIKLGDRNADVDRHLSGGALGKLHAPEFVLNPHRAQAFEEFLADLAHDSSPCPSCGAPSVEDRTHLPNGDEQ